MFWQSQGGGPWGTGPRGGGPWGGGDRGNGGGPGPRGPEGEEDAVFGLGLGFFIAKTLLERSGATLALINQAPPLHGATVTVTWSRADFEQPIAAPALEPAAPAA